MNWDGIIDYDFIETPYVGLYYEAKLISGNTWFEFSINIVSNEENPEKGETKAYLHICFDPVLSTFYFNEDITYLKNHSNFLSRWVFWAIYNYRLTHHAINLESVFHYSTLRIYGSPRQEIDEVELLMNHILNTANEPIIVYHFGHVDQPFKLRFFSYAIWIHLSDNPDFWAFLPDCCGLDSGGSRRYYRKIESYLDKIEQKVGLERRRYDIDYNDLEQFLIDNSTSFHKSYSSESVNKIHFRARPWHLYPTGDNVFAAFEERYEKRQFPQAIRDLRTMVQEAQTKVLNVYKQTIPEKPTIKKLKETLISTKLIDPRLGAWFDAFCSYANVSAHQNYPSEDDLIDTIIEKRTFMTVNLGMHLLLELERKLRKPDVKNFDIKKDMEH